MTGWFGTAVLLGVLTSSPAQAQSTAPQSEAARDALHGTLREAGRRTPIATARVLAVPGAPDAALGPLDPADHLDPSAAPPAWIETTQTDADGRFTFPNLPAARVRLVVIAPGYARTEQVVDVARSQRRSVVVFAPVDESTAMRTVVRTRADPPPEQVKSTAMESEEIRTAPGTQGDPLRALQNLPGVARTPGGFGLLILRGASPNQSRVFLGGHALPRAFHSLAIASVVPADAIDRMEFVPSNFGARYGDATGGLVVLHPATPDRSGVHGHGRVDLLGMGASVHGPVGKGTYYAAAQRGWVDAVLMTAERVAEDAAFTLPRYYDYQAFFDHPVGPGVLSVRALGAGDRLQARSAGFGSRPFRVFEMVAQFHRADLSYRVRRGPWSFWLTPSARLERNGWRQPLVSSSTSIREDAVVSVRAEASRSVTRSTSVTVGADAEVDRFRTDLKRPGNVSTGEPPRSEQLQGVASTVGAYVQSSLAVQQWTFSPGLRASAFTLDDAAATAIDPRLSAHWRFAPRWRWSMGLGLYSQARVQQSTVSADFVGGTADQIAGRVVLPASLLSLEPRAGFAPVPGGLSVARAAQASTAFGRELGDSWFVEMGSWVRIQDNADGFRRDDGELRVETATGSLAYGLEALVRRRLGPQLWGWAGYTLARVEDRILDRVGVASAPDVTPSSFDQRHNLVLLASYQLPHRWRIGGRFRLVSGAPFTDVVGVVWVPPREEPLAAAGSPNGARFPTFHQLDLRVDKSWVLQRVQLSAYVDVQNVYNKLNPEAYIYNADFSRRADAIGLPIFPSLGFRIDY